jgi:hypothetical protein
MTTSGQAPFVERHSERTARSERVVRDGIGRQHGSAPATRRGQSRRSKIWLVLLSLSAVAVAAFSPRLFSGRSSVAVTEPASELMPTGTIAESDADVCKRLTFDDHGQVVRDVVPCDGSVRDAHGQPVPAGTIQRLNAISKSFTGH